MIYHFLKKIIFPFSVISFTSIGLIIYSRSLKPDSDIGGGFGRATVTISNKYFCNASEYNCVKEILSDFETYKKKVLLFGNSQLAAINQLENSQINYADNLSRKIEKNESLNLILRSFWMPNANLSEFNLINKSLNECSVDIDIMIIPVFLDDTRINNIRDSLGNYTNKICEDIFKFERNNEKLDKYKSIVNSKKVEGIILSNTPILKDMSNLNIHFRTFLYKFRNSIFGITASTKRKILPAAYNANIDSLREIISSRNLNKLSTIVYIPPLLNSSTKKPIPYNRDEYTSLKNQIQEICSGKYCNYFDLDREVPDNLWGTKASTRFEGEELDFMHFTYSGHVIFSDKLFNIISKIKQSN